MEKQPKNIHRNKQKTLPLPSAPKATNGTMIKNIFFIIIIMLHSSRDWEFMGILKLLKQLAENTTMQVIR